MANVLIDLYLGLFENYILKLKSSLKAGTIWGYYSFGFKKEVKRDTHKYFPHLLSEVKKPVSFKVDLKNLGLPGILERTSVT